MASADESNSKLATGFNLGSTGIDIKRFASEVKENHRKKTRKEIRIWHVVVDQYFVPWSICSMWHDDQKRSDIPTNEGSSSRVGWKELPFWLQRTPRGLLKENAMKAQSQSFFFRDLLVKRLRNINGNVNFGLDCSQSAHSFPKTSVHKRYEEVTFGSRRLGNTFKRIQG
ncbi:hypothetical protein TNCV_3219501 [Trichonephila clavipes]|nr:hypothetical protein TNCV_3219501 [Trichonephila clavipes]